MNNILIPTDFSDYADAAAAYAIEIGKLAGARLHFVHIQSTAVEWNLISIEDQKKYPDTLKAIGHSKLALNEWIRKAESKGVKADRSLIFDAGVNELTNHIQRHHYDLVVMGSHGAKGIIEKVMGSNTQEVMRSAEAPLLIIKAPVLVPVKKMLIVADFVDPSKNDLLPLTHFANTLGTAIELLFVNVSGMLKTTEEVFSNMDAMMANVHEEKYLKNLIEADTIENGVKFFIAKSPVDLIAICTHGRGGFRQFVSPNIAEKIVDGSKLPVLSLKL